MLTLDEAGAVLRYQHDEAVGVLLRPRWQPKSPAWEHARERELQQAIHAINYHSHRRPA